MTLTDAQAALAKHLHSNAIRTDGPFTLRSGAVSDWYLDARQTTFDGEGALLVGAAVLEQLADVVAVGGLTMGADPVALGTAMFASQQGRLLRAFSIRKDAKDHGTGGRLVGPVDPGDRVAIVEDTTTTGGAFFEAIGAAIEAGLEVIQAVALVDRSGNAVTDLMANRGINYSIVLRPAQLGFEV
jgi:orotate phosphoribosyltransferase